ncbi:MAG: hypothetical protein HLX50_17990 [Alteromonadaceae bacterium]|nr:hypothetical protein [Alteromonadaceae bacterium]
MLKKRSSTIDRYGLELQGDKVRLDGSAPINYDLLDKAIEKIARGLYFHHSEKTRKLLGKLYVFPLFLGVSPLATREEGEKIRHIARLTELDIRERGMITVYPDVFSYQVIESSKIAVVNMVIYGDRIISVMGERA